MAGEVAASQRVADIGGRPFVAVRRDDMGALGQAARGEADIGRPELRPREEEDDEPETERDVLGRGEDADLFGRELVEVTDRDGERARGREDGDVRDQERGDGADEDRPEAPERRRGGRVGRL